MLLLAAETLLEGVGWSYELKLDGYRALAVKTNGTVRLRSRNDKDFNSRYPGIVKALAALPDETVVDGEVVALDAAGRPSFNALQNGGAAVFFYVFDVLILAGRNVMGETLAVRRELLNRAPRLAILAAKPLIVASNSSLRVILKVVLERNGTSRFFRSLHICLVSTT
jgi:ATP-dependent DNA ligase